jgi:hypothetical protein
MRAVSRSANRNSSAAGASAIDRQFSDLGLFSGMASKGLIEASSRHGEGRALLVWPTS